MFGRYVTIRFAEKGRRVVGRARSKQVIDWAAPRSLVVVIEVAGSWQVSSFSTSKQGAIYVCLNVLGKV